MSEDITQLPRSYREALVRGEIPFKEDARYDEAKMRAFLRSYARNTATMVSAKNLENDVRDFSLENQSISKDTVAAYLRFLTRTFVIEEQAAWSPGLRSKTRIQTGSKRHFCDPSLAAAALNAAEESLLGDLRTLGFLFESLCVHDLRIYAQAMDANVCHYRDDRGLECDIIIEAPGRHWAPIVVKLGMNEVDKAAENLIKLKNTMMESGARKLDFMAVLVGLGDYAFQREDGVLVLPLSCIRP